MVPTELTGFPPLDRVLARILDVLPILAAALGAAVLGVALTVLLRWLTMAVVRRSGLEGLAERAGVARILYAMGIHAGLARALGNVVAVFGSLATLAVVAEIVHLPGLAEGIGAVVEFIPRVVAAATIFLFGLLGGDVLRRVVAGVGRRRGDLLAPGLVASAAYWTVVVVAGTVALEHLGLQTGLVQLLIAVAAAALAFGVAAALVVSGRHLLRDLLSRYYAERQFPAGSRVVVGDVDGVVVAYGPTAASLRTEDGEVVVPCSHLLDRPVRVDRI